MAHFAEIDDNNKVLRVIVVSNSDTQDAQGIEHESIGAAFCASLFGGTWLQTSYNATMRKNYAGVNYTYDAQRDAFIAPQPYASWLLDDDTCRWCAPVPTPEDGIHRWNENAQEWAPIDSN